MSELTAPSGVWTGPGIPARSGAGWAELARYGLGGIVIGMSWTVLLLTAFALGIGLFPFGLVVTGGTLLLVPLGAQIERDRLARIFGERLEPAERPLPSAGFWRRVRAASQDAAIWRDTAYLLMSGPVSLLTVAAAAVWTALPIAGLTALVWLPSQRFSVAGVEIGSVPGVVVLTLTGLLAAVTWPLAPGFTLLPCRWIARSLLGPDVRRLSSQLVSLTAHSEMVERVAATERRRLERDLHDGAQQQLVAAGISLGMLIDRLERHGAHDEVVDLAQDARRQIVASVDELRHLAQGIHPVALATDGLTVALEELAGRAPIAVDLAVSLVEPVPEPVGRAAYFVTSEAITNATRHAGTDRVSVSVASDPGSFRLDISDAGVGGAIAVPGGGIAGLVDRVESVGGTLEVRSQPGEGTALRMRFPRTTKP